MKLLCLLLLLALARPPRQGELNSRAVLVNIAGVSCLRFTFQSRARQPIEFGLPIGTPLRAMGQAGEPVYLVAPLHVKLKPAERREVTLPVVSAQPPGEGSYVPSAVPADEPHVRRVHKVLVAGGSRELARFALLPPEQLTPEIQTRLTSFQLPPLALGTGLTSFDLTDSARYTLESGRITLITPTIRSKAPLGTVSGRLRAGLWVSRQGSYQGGILDGYRLGEFDLGSLSGGGVWPPFTLNLELRRPPAGSYTMVFALEELTPNGYLITHWINYPGLVNF